MTDLSGSLTMVIVRPANPGATPFQRAVSWLIDRGDPNLRYLGSSSKLKSDMWENAYQGAIVVRKQPRNSFTQNDIKSRNVLGFLLFFFGTYQTRLCPSIFFLRNGFRNTLKPKPLKPNPLASSVIPPPCQ